MMMSEILDELKEMQIENKEIMKTLNAMNIGWSLFNESSPVDLSYWKYVIQHLDCQHRIELTYQYPKFRVLEKSIPLRLWNLRISKNTISVNTDMHYKITEEKRRSDDFEEFSPISVFVGDLSVSQKTIDAVTKAVFAMFGERSEIYVYEWFWSEIPIPFELNLHAKYAVISSKEGKHLSYISKAVDRVDTLIVKDVDYAIGFKEKLPRRVDRFEYLKADDPLFTENFMCYKKSWMDLYFDTDTSQCENLILSWLSIYGKLVKAELRLAFHESREAEAIDRIMNSPKIANSEFLHHDRAEVKMTVQEYTRHFNYLFRYKPRFTKYLCFEVKPKDVN